MKFYILTLGCPKNDVDSEGMHQLLRAAGHHPALKADEADALIVNTCGFIEAAREESIDHLRRLATLKRRSSQRNAFTTSARKIDIRTAGGEAIAVGTPLIASRPRAKLLIAAGCLGERFAADLVKQVPELDGVLGTLRWGDIATLLDNAADGAHPCWTGEPLGQSDLGARISMSRPSAYLKIADGCDASCTFCAIPAIKGPQHSRSVASIIAEAQQLAAQGVKEIVLIAQDTTAFGRDRAQADALAALLERMVDEVPDVSWFRIMYAYPAHITDRLLSVIAGQPRILPYVDLPLQHAHDDVLKRMRRPLNGRQVVARLREAIPNVAIRSSFIVGFPGETEPEFRSLLAFLEEMRFDRVGVFTYSPEEGTSAAGLKPQVAPKAKRTRFDRAMALQQQISARRNEEMVGRVLDVLVEGAGGANAGDSYGSVGRSYRDAPEVDGLVFVRQILPVGEIARVSITKALPYDLVGEVVVGSDHSAH